ncbi:MAG: polysaccharide biosynthesis tyrosine autokinase [Pyrinomonadaceae bacterium]|nr:polysaccharide biosynthesis tyrosine autokinase [Pyrinomonadaceae bacterium]
MKDSREIIKKPVAEAVELEIPFDAATVAGARYPGYRDIYAQEGFQLKDYWRAIRKRLWLVIGIAVLVTTLAAIYMARKPDIYLAKGTVQVDLEQANPDLVTDNRRLPSANPDPSYFNTQLQLLNSEGLLRRVVKELSLDSNKAFQVEKSNQSTSTTHSILKAIGLASDGEKKEEKGIAEVSVAADSDIASSDEIEEAIRLAPYVEILRKNLGVEPVRESRATIKETRLIEITYRNTDRQLAALIVNGIAGTFTKSNQEKKFGSSKKSNQFLEDRIASLQSEIKAGELRLELLNRQAGILKPDDQPSIAMSRLAELNKKLLEAENERKNAESIYFSVKDSPDKIKSLTEEQNIRFLTERENDIRSLVNDTAKEIARLKATRAKLLEEYVETAPEIREYDRQIKTLESEIAKARERNEKALEEFRGRSTRVILDNLQTKYLQAKATEDKIRSAYDQQYNLASGQNQSAVSISLLQQEIDTKKGFLKNLIDNQSQNDVIASGTENNISVAEIAIPPDTPVSPRRLTTVAAALFLSTLFGMGLALFLEYLDDTIRTTEEIENYLQLPALAAIPTIDSVPKRRLLLVGASDSDEEVRSPESELLIHMDTRSSLSEAFRQLRTSILLSTAGHAPKSLLITSSLPAEGKTTTAINTAISLAQTGAKVLIIDADMRRPRLHSVFNISNSEGLSTLLSTKLSEQDILDAVQFDEAAKLHLLPSGPVPPNPAELIGSEQMSKLLKSLEEKFTHVVVDSPPIASFTDGVLIASMVDGVILVVHAGKSSRHVVRRSKQLLHDIGSKIFGVVLNNANLRGADNYYHYYQSYYHRESDIDEE